MPFDVLYPHVPEDNPTGVYRFDFDTIPKYWLISEIAGSDARRRVVLHLGGVESCFLVYLNGEFVGLGKDSRLPSEFDVTEHIAATSAMSEKCGTSTANALVIIVLKYCDGSFMEQQDHWRGMGGIHRSVFLYSTFADAFIEDVYCQASITNIDQKCSNQSFPPKHQGRLKINARIGRRNDVIVKGKNIYYNEQVSCTRPGDVSYRMLFQLFDTEGNAIFDEPIDPSYEGNKLVSDSHLRSHIVSFTVDVPGNVLAWSDESPVLYKLRATLIQINPTNPDFKCDVDAFSCSVGFRNVEISNRQLLINGQPVLIKGVVSYDRVAFITELKTAYSLIILSP